VADTGAPWNIPFAEPTDLVRDWPQLSEDVADAVAAGLTEALDGFDAREVITATDASWPVPSLLSPIVRVTVIGGGGGGGAANNGTGGTDGGTGGTTTFNASTAGTVTATGGPGGPVARRLQSLSPTMPAGTAGLSAGNSGAGGVWSPNDGGSVTAGDGRGGQITIGYLDLTSISTVNVTIGAGGSAGTGNRVDGSAGGRGEVIVEYKAA